MIFIAIITYSILTHYYEVPKRAIVTTTKLTTSTSVITTQAFSSSTRASNTTAKSVADVKSTTHYTPKNVTTLTSISTITTSSTKTTSLTTKPFKTRTYLNEVRLGSLRINYEVSKSLERVHGSLVKEYVINGEYLVYSKVSIVRVKSLSNNAYIKVVAKVRDERGHEYVMNICYEYLRKAKSIKYCLSPWIITLSNCRVKYLINVSVINANAVVSIELIKVKALEVPKYSEFRLLDRELTKYLLIKVSNVSSDELLVIRGLCRSKRISVVSPLPKTTSCYLSKYGNYYWEPTGYVVPMDSVAIPPKVVMWESKIVKGRVIKGGFLRNVRRSGDVYLVITSNACNELMKITTYSNLSSINEVKYLSVGDVVKAPLVTHAEGVLVGVRVPKAPAYVVLEVTIKGKLLSRYWMLGADLINSSLGVTATTPLSYVSNSLRAKIYLPTLRSGNYLIYLSYTVPRFYGDYLIIKYVGIKEVRKSEISVIKEWSALKGYVRRG